MNILQRLKKWLSDIVADEPCSHEWGRAAPLYRAVECSPDGKSIVVVHTPYVKKCKLCGITEAVKRRVKKETK